MTAPTTQIAARAQSADALTRELLDTLQMMVQHFTKTPSTLADSKARGRAHEVIAKAYEQIGYTAPTAALEKPSDALYTMDQMRDYALAFHKSRLDARGDLTAKQKWDIAERVHSQCEALKPHATFRSAASQAINDTIAALSQKAGDNNET